MPNTNTKVTIINGRDDFSSTKIIDSSIQTLPLEPFYSTQLRRIFQHESCGSNYSLLELVDS